MIKFELFQPDHLRSPTWLTIFQRGNSFECATLLVSFLLGQGYNAYVVSGYASREQVERNMTKRPCPYLPQNEEPPPSKDSNGPARYQLKQPPDFRSQFLREMEAKEEKVRADELKKEEEERQRKIEVFSFIFLRYKSLNGHGQSGESKRELDKRRGGGASMYPLPLIISKHILFPSHSNS